jgi:hypothetical protein
VINGGSFTISSGDDGMHADAAVVINDGNIHITKSYEGIESAVITVNSGDIHITSSDDGINVSTGNGGTRIDPRRDPGQDNFTSAVNNYLYIKGGDIAVEANGDGFDINGAIEMTGGQVIINGPTANDNGALDYYNSFKITSGFLVAAGSAGMAQSPGNTSTQNSLLLNFNVSQQAETIIHIQTSEGKGILTFAPSKTYQSVAFSSAELITGSTYHVYLGGSSTGTVNNGLYQNGIYTPGNLYTTFTISTTVTTIGSSGFHPPHR